MDNSKEYPTHTGRENLPGDLNKTTNTGLFNDTSLFYFISKKTEKLATALYMVTNLFYESEPLKWTLRKKISDLLSFILKHRDVYMAGSSEFVHDAKKGVAEVLSLLEVASGSGLISPMNFSIIRSEFVSLIEHIEKISLQIPEQDHRELPRSFFDVSRITDEHVFPAPQKENSEGVSHNTVKDKTLTPDVNPQIKRTNRQNIILQLLKRKKELTIKDIALVIKDCSEKTIQREVIDLIEAGVLKKTGERRWSKYSLTLPSVE